MISPITYYGGKTRMLKYILPLLPEVMEEYTEPFVGGGSLFWRLCPKPRVSILNDINGNVANFYKVAKNRFEELNFEIQNTLHCQWTYDQAKYIYRYPKGKSELMRAWAFWCCANMSFGGRVADTFQITTNSTHKVYPPVTSFNKRKRFSELHKALEKALILNVDALTILNKFNKPNVFAYCDPPYVNANQGHYKGYTQEDFDNLLEALSIFKGKFILSSYLNDSLTKFIEKCGWHTEEIEMNLDVTKEHRKKIEKLTWNFNVPMPEPSVVQGVLNFHN